MVLDWHSALTTATRYNISYRFNIALYRALHRHYYAECGGDTDWLNGNQVTPVLAEQVG